MLENANLGGDEVEPTDFGIVSEEQTERVEELEKACEMYKVQLQDAQQQDWEATAHIDMLEKQLETSEGFKLKEMAMTSILKLTAMSDVDKLGRD
jgi:lipase chaperone LimK